MDIDYTITRDPDGVPSVDDNLEVLMIDRSVTPAVTNRAIRFLQAPLPMTAGQHRITWNANGDGVTNYTDRASFVMKIAHYVPAYMVIDVSEGPDAETYPVDFFNGEATAALRNVRWEEEDGSAIGMSEENGTRTDLREGVRKPKRVEEILPFTYSSTNWIGVAGATSESTVRVKIVQMTGTTPDVCEWTDEVPDTTRVLMKGPGEAAVKWKVEGKGVWKASFDILTDDECVHHEEAWFDLRKTKGINGFMLILR